MRKIIVTLFLCFVWTAGLANAANEHDLLVNSTITQLMQQYQIPGAAIALIDKGKPHIYTFGVADETSQKPITRNTIFEIGSVTKLFTAILFIADADKHEVAKTSTQKIENTGEQKALYDSLTKYYPELNSNPYLKKITIGRLLTYTAGMPFNLQEDITSIDQAQDYFLHWRPASPIGTKWQYSNVSVGLVGIALQNKDNKTIDQLYNQYILQPLHMSTTGFAISKKRRPLFAQGYTETGEAAPHQPIGLFPAAGDLKSSIQDMAKFLVLAVNRFDMSQDLKIAMQDTQKPRLMIGNVEQGLIWQVHSLGDKSLLNEPEKMDLGPTTVKWLPKQRQVYNGDKLIDKTGATNGFRTYIAVIPSQQEGIVILLNKYIPNGAIVNAGRKILLEEKTYANS
jgi:beta-lactamase class C